MESQQASMGEKSLPTVTSPQSESNPERVIIPFYHGAFEFYLPYPLSFLRPFLTLKEYDDILQEINIKLVQDLPGKRKQLRRLTLIALILCFSIIGILFGLIACIVLA